MNPKFSPFNKHGPLEIYHRSLPHWRQAGATYFTTFRLADSIPRSVLETWNQERQAWLTANGVSETLPEPERAAAYLKIDSKRRRNFERSHARKLFTELDQCRGCCIFQHKQARSILAESMLFYHGQRYWAGDFVIMPNHVHWIIQPLKTHPLEKILQSIKRFTSTELSRQELHHESRLWQSESHDHIIRDREELQRIRQYIQDNPGKAKLQPRSYTRHTADWLD